MKVISDSTSKIDHCRIGSLEMQSSFSFLSAIDHCRIGSLEKCKRKDVDNRSDHCRIGSLEIFIIFN